jgi:hypothetical protein
MWGRELISVSHVDVLYTSKKERLLKFKVCFLPHQKHRIVITNITALVFFPLTSVSIDEIYPILILP